MVSFRYHLISLIAVFLALAMGIAVGAAVVDRATVTFLEERLAQVENRREATNRRNDRLEAEVDRFARFSEQADDALVRGRLNGASVLLISVRGVSRRDVAEIRTALAAAGAVVQGTLWFTPRLILREAPSLESLRIIVGAGAPSGADADAVRRVAVEQLGSALAAGDGSSIIRSLSEGGFLEFEAASGPSDPGAVAAVGTRFVVVSSAAPEVGNDQAALPLTRQLALAGAPVAALDVTPEATAGGSPEAPFAAALRSAQDVATRLSTVDGASSWIGRTAAVLVVEDLGNGKRGHYGIAPRAQRLLPAQ